MDLRDGLIWWSSPRATCGMVVQGGVVVDCAPFVRRWAMGRDARQLWQGQTRRGHDLRWIPSEPPA